MIETALPEPLYPQSRSALALGEVVDLLRRAERAGADPEDILRRAKVPYRLVDLSADKPSLIARRHLVAIFRECVVAIGWHSSRADHKPQMQPAEFRLMCHAIITSRSLAEVIERQILFFETRREKLSRMALSVDQGRAHVTIDTMRKRSTISAFLSDLVGVMAFARLYAWLLGMDAEAFSVHLAHDQRFGKYSLIEWPENGIRYGEAAGGVSFPAALLERPIVRSPVELEALLSEFPFDFLSRRLTAIAWKDRLRSLYLASLRNGQGLPALDNVAAQMGLSGITLRRQLAREGTSIRKVRDEAREALARQLAQGEWMKVEDLATRLGFRDLASFRTAYRRWTGALPGQARRGIRVGTNNRMAANPKQVGP